MDILLIEDNKELGQLIFDFISTTEYTVSWVQSAEEALQEIENTNYRLLLLDVMLPGQDGFSALACIRKNYNMPVLMMSARTDDESKILGMETGADDYIEKPFSIPVLLSKIRALLRRSYPNQESNIMIYKNIKVDIGARTVMKSGQSVDVSGKEFDILVCLMKKPGQVVDKNELFDEVWGYYSDTEMSSLNVYIRWLREKIEDDPKEPIFIKTVWGKGYKFGE
ncbi:DNA-binding response regulator, OmpR family, contains REC and winged-helix (wHTH) domain [Pseudobutyrivibrio sp. NOR37]|uniref:Stage 0 sporulation protein A homolog n=1 Tax=Pseudobutyrivibrio xylanivorans TaxID=185007 RepID=A0A6M0LK58_PSEXY|nr:MULTISPECIES: response regulator transcription factor [Pseudobutyrivibrio]NEX02786.1 response regulator transcription factor [Pseudobutyrivibrio xylanivorans]SCY36158.1 DNA-binding response regulator, OmpR family, contains REC and winged-helix (wHTH) domain [Pseudobutyrivibrio sp. AR14]SFR81094.1 DNA-binding response regulator, OmpR family, contains REC and winged-helix (wHTH) domain [Pseudobutyrivibrio sp. NOR37]